MNATPDLDARLAGMALLNVRRVAGLLGVSPRQIWRLTAKAAAGHGTFPKPLRLGTRTVRWRLADVESYLAALAGEEGP